MYNSELRKELDLYLLCKLDKRLGQPKINEPRIKKYASRLNIDNETINDYLSMRNCSYFKGVIVLQQYETLLNSFYNKDPLLWQRLPMEIKPKESIDLSALIKKVENDYDKALSSITSSKLPVIGFEVLLEKLLKLSEDNPKLKSYMINIYKNEERNYTPIYNLLAGDNQLNDSYLILARDIFKIISKPLDDSRSSTLYNIIISKYKLGLNYKKEEDALRDNSLELVIDRFKGINYHDTVIGYVVSDNGTCSINVSGFKNWNPQAVTAAIEKSARNINIANVNVYARGFNIILKDESEARKLFNKLRNGN